MPLRARPGSASAIALALAVALALAGCDGGPPPAPTSAGSQPAVATPPGPPTPPGPTRVPNAGGSAGVLAAELDVTAENIAFTPTKLVGPAGAPLTVRLRNLDAGVPHNIAIRAGVPANDVAPEAPDLFAGEVVAGPVVKAYAVPGLPAGVYTFFCKVHPNMVGTLTLR